MNAPDLDAVPRTAALPATKYGALLRGSGARPRILSAIFSAIMMVGAFRLPVTISGMIDASTTRRPCTPCTRPWPSTTAISSSPILQEHDGW